MGTLLLWIGGLWALIGAGWVVAYLVGAFAGANSVGIKGLAVLAYFLFFILPGLAVAGIGLAIRRRRAGRSRGAAAGDTG